MINRKNFMQSVCMVFTCVVLGKVILEGVMQHQDVHYIPNTLFAFLISLCATAIMALHKYFVNVPLLFVIIGQYVLVIALTILMVYISSFWEPISEGGYFDFIRSVTVPYVILAVIYYISYFRKVHNANQVLREIQQIK